MAFRRNDYQQIRIDDEYNGLSDRTKKIVDKSWARIFADVVFHLLMKTSFLYYTATIMHPEATHPSTLLSEH